LVSVRGAGLRFELRQADPAMVEALQPLRPHQLRERLVLPELQADAVTDLIIQPRNGVPDLFSRQADGDWPADEAPVVNAFVRALQRAAVSEWRGPLTKDLGPQDFDSTVTLSTGSDTWTIRLRQDGLVAVLERSLVGVLDNRSRREVMEQ
jgi:hypothetical protein